MYMHKFSKMTITIVMTCITFKQFKLNKILIEKYIIY